MLIPNRSILSLQPKDRAIDLLNKISTANFALIDSGKIIYSFFLSPNGKYAADFFCFCQDDLLLLDYDTRNEEIIRKILLCYTWDGSCTIKSAETSVFLQQKDEIIKQNQHFLSYEDPRFPLMRVYHINKSVENDTNDNCNAEDLYRQICLQYFVPDGYIDMISGKCFITDFGPLPNGSLHLEKGCFVGAETMARIIYRLKKTRNMTLMATNLIRQKAQKSDSSDSYIRTDIEYNNQQFNCFVSQRSLRWNSTFASGLNKSSSRNNHMAC